MNISGIRPISGFYSGNTNSMGAFGSYDVVRQQKPSEGIKTASVDKAFSRTQVERAVDVMKRDGSLHKYQTFVGTVTKVSKEPLVRRNELENFTL